MAQKAKKPTKVTKVRKVKKVKKVKRVKGKPILKKGDITTSKGELIFEAWLRAIGVQVEAQFQLGYKFYDFKVKDENVLIEYDGDFYHCNPKLYPNGPESKMQAMNVKNDEYKNKLARSNGYKLFRIWESDFKEGNKTEIKERILKFINE